MSAQRNANQLQAIILTSAPMYVPLTSTGDQHPRGARDQPACQLHLRVRRQAAHEPSRPAPTAAAHEAIRSPGGGAADRMGRVASGLSAAAPPEGRPAGRDAPPHEAIANPPPP